MIYENYQALAMRPEDWSAVAAQGFSVEVAIPKSYAPLPRGACNMNANVTAAVKEYLELCAAFPRKTQRRGKLKQIAQKYGIRPNSVCTRLNRQHA